MNLSLMGWSSFFEDEDFDTDYIARVIAVHRSHMIAITQHKEINLHFSGQVSQAPAVGDWVVTTPEFVDEQNVSAALIKKVLQRKSKISRSSSTGEQVIAANIDNVFIVTSANQDFNINRMHRFLLLIHEGGARPVVVLSKTDLDKDHQILIDTIKEKLSVDVIGTSILGDSGLKELLAHMPEGSTSVFVGSSGVGKSSLVNKILGQELQVTRFIREDDSKGRHATTSRQLFFVQGHGMIIDTPGVREVQVFGSAESLGEVFQNIEELIGKCKFSNCQHETEAGCAILEGLTTGELERGEWENYLKLLREMAYVNRKQDKAAASNAKKRWRDINIAMRKKRKFER